MIKVGIITVVNDNNTSQSSQNTSWSTELTQKSPELQARYSTESRDFSFFLEVLSVVLFRNPPFH